MSSRKVAEILTSGESQKQSSVATKTKQKRTSNASDSLPGPINLAKKIAKKTSVSQKTIKVDQKNVKTPKTIKKNEKESEDPEDKKDLTKKLTKQKPKEKLIAKMVKKTVKEVKKIKNLSSGNNEKVDKFQKPKKSLKKLDDKEEKKSKEKVQKEKKIKEIKKKPIQKQVKKNLEETESIKPRLEVKAEKKEKPKKAKVITKNKIKINSSKEIDDNAPLDCLNVVKEENSDDVPLLQVFQLKNGPVCDFDGNVCNTITIRQDNTCIKIKEISVSQLPYSVKTEENEKIDVTAMPVKKEFKQAIEKQKIDKQKTEKPKNEKQKTEKQKIEKQLKDEKRKIDKNQKDEKPKIEKQKVEKQKSEKQKPEKHKIEKQKVDKLVAKPVKVEKKKKPVVVEKIKSKVKPKATTKPKAKGRPVSKRPRVASLNAIAKVHCLYENESKSALIDAMSTTTPTMTVTPASKVKHTSDVDLPVRKGKRTSKRTAPGLKSVGRHWDMHETSSTNSSSSGNIIELNNRY